MIKKNLLLVITGHTIEPARSQFGNTDKHFEHAAGTGVKLLPYAICEEWPMVPLPPLKEFSGVIMTGSASMLSDDAPWMQAAKNLVAQCLSDNVPFLGVCFGHQILGAVCGAKIGPNPMGRANGSVDVTIREPSPLFAGLHKKFVAQISHRDIILENHSEFRVIASAGHDPRHAIQVGQNSFGVQFHPEWDMDISKAYIYARQETLGVNSAKNMLATLKHSPEASLVVHNFIRGLQ